MSQYIIKSGDTLSKIAQQFGYGGDYMSIAKANNITNPNVIQAGATLNIPDRSAPGAAPASVPAPIQQPTQPVVSQPQVQSGGIPPVDMSKYQGWNDQAAIQADWAANWQSKSGGGTTGTPGVQQMFTNQVQTPDLSGQWDKFLETINTTFQPQIATGNEEMKVAQDKITARTEALNVALGKINDNPYYSEATRVGRARKLQEQYNNDVALLNSQVGIAQNKVANVQNQISQAKADAQVKLNIDTQMYNIKNQQYQNNLQMFNSLLTSGALNTATGTDIAQIATTTGMSTSMVQSIIDASKKSKEEKPKLETVDDGTNQYVVAFDSKGNIINKQVIASSKPKTTTGGGTNETMNTQKLYDKYDTQIAKILKEADAMNVDDEDHKLSEWEQESAIQRISALAGVSREVAFDMLAKGMSAGGYGNWTP